MFGCRRSGFEVWVCGRRGVGNSEHRHRWNVEVAKLKHRSSKIELCNLVFQEEFRCSMFGFRNWDLKFGVQIKVQNLHNKPQKVLQSPQVTTEPSSSLRTSVTKCRFPPSRDGAVVLPSHIRHEVQSHQVTTEPSSSLRTSVTKCRGTKSRRSHLPPFAHPSRSTDSPKSRRSHLRSFAHPSRSTDSPKSRRSHIFLPSHIRHEMQSPQVTTEPSSSLRTSVTKYRFT